MKLSSIVDSYLENRPIGITLSEDQIGRNLLKAVRYYCGYQTLTNGELDDDGIHTKVNADNDIDSQDFDLTPSEHSIILPLFELYCERENANSLEASRGLGVDVYGRTVSEVQQDITTRETELMHKLAFFEPPVSV